MKPPAIVVKLTSGLDFVVLPFFQQVALASMIGGLPIVLLTLRERSDQRSKTYPNTNALYVMSPWRLWRD